MKIADLIKSKGSSTVITIAPESIVAELVALLAKHNIGAVVVSTDGQRIEGIASERDIVRALAAKGATMKDRVSDIMTTTVHTAELEETIESVAHVMTAERHRHVPVVADGKIVGLVSIGDVVKNRIDQLTEERNHLVGYLHS